MEQRSQPSPKKAFHLVFKKAIHKKVFWDFPENCYCPSTEITIKSSFLLFLFKMEDLPYVFFGSDDDDWNKDEEGESAQIL